MRFVKFKVSNYKSFLESPELRFAPGLNVIVGQNNSGKTALLKAMGLNFPDTPHRSLETMPSRTTPLQPRSSVDYVFAVDGFELRTLMLDNFPSSYIPVDGDKTPVAEAQAVAPILNNRDVAFRSSFGPNPGFSGALLDAYPGAPGDSSMLQCHATPTSIVVDSKTYFKGTERLPSRIAPVFRSRIYLFEAERMTLGQSAMGTSTQLLPNAGNLAQVLNFLSTDNPARFERFQSYVRDVFPQIHRITIPPISQQEARILVWTQNVDPERNDLAIPLAESGTGIGQVLAMLYVLLTSDYPRVLLIDEPQSFLHPSAIRKLLEIFAAHPQHQYVITTHSPTALASFLPGTLTLLTMDGAKTIAKQVNPAEATELRAVLAEVGARLSDVFGADNILWVEGATEEACFPLILEQARRDTDHATGTVILGVRHTAEFQPRDVRATVEIYHRLTAGRALMPPAVGFIFDPEGLSEQQQQDVKRQSDGLVRFLPRRTFENYLLTPEGIAFLMNSIEGFRPTPIQGSEVSDWIVRHKWDSKYFEPPVIAAAQTDDVWLKTVHGARLLRDMFSELSAQRVVYDKVKHGVKLTTWICASAFDSFREIANVIREAIAAGASPRQT